MQSCRIDIHIRLAALAAAFILVPSMANAASAEKGQALYLKYGCWQCHGTVGQGAITGPKLAPDPLPYEALANFVRTTNGQMPPYRQAVLPDADLADIYAYLQSIPPPPDPKSLPLLK
jgi:mono/diheme cytochrome c family protein